MPLSTIVVGGGIVALEAGEDGVRVETERGEVFGAEVLVGADGIRSTVRAQFFGPNEPVYLGYRSHRFVVPNVGGLEHFTEFLGHGKRVGLVPIGGGQLYVWTTFNSPLESRSWALESMAALRGLFGELTDGRVQRAFGELTSTDGVVCTDIEEVRQAAWATTSSTTGSTKATTSSDACHSTTVAWLSRPSHTIVRGKAATPSVSRQCSTTIGRSTRTPSGTCSRTAPRENAVLSSVN